MKKFKKVVLTLILLLFSSIVFATEVTPINSEDGRCKIVHKEDGVKIKVVADTCDEARETMELLLEKL